MGITILFLIVLCVLIIILFSIPKLTLMKKILIIVSVLLVFFSVLVYVFITGWERGREPKRADFETEIEKTNDSIKKTDTAKSNTNNAISKKDIQEIEVFDASKILFNGKNKRFFSLKEFDKNFGKADSIQLMSEEAPCSYIFENEDGKDDKYLFKNGSRFENSNDSVAVNEYRFLKGNFIIYKGLKIDAETTIEDLKKIFPNAVKNIQDDEHYNEKKLQSIILREDPKWISDGHIRIFFKESKIYSIWWWFPC